MPPRTSQTHGIAIDMQRAEHHYRLMRTLDDLYTKAGYRPYRVPLIDSYSGYSDTLDAAYLQRSFRFVNSDGDLVLVRPDLTLFLARHATHTLRDDDLPLRLWYSDSVVRNVPSAEGDGVEQYQSGVELIGESGDEGEIELLVLMGRALRRLGLEDSVIHIGSRRLLDTVITNGHTIDYTAFDEGRRTIYEQRQAKSIAAALANRREEELPPLLFGCGYEQKGEARALTTFLMHIGDAAASLPPLPRLQHKSTATALHKELLRLQRIARAVAEHNADAPIRIRIDISEVGAQDYYTGTTFAAYHPSIADRIASGGRYDWLFPTYGFDTTAAGFTLFLYRCEQHAMEVKGDEGGTGDAPARRAPLRPTKRPASALSLSPSSSPPPMITVAVPKGRLLTDIRDYFAQCDMPFDFHGRELITTAPGVNGAEHGATIRWILVKNIDVPTYVSSGAAALGIVGSDILDEYPHPLFRHVVFPFGKANLCLINRQDATQNELHNGVKIASKYRAASKRYLSKLGISGSIYPLNGSLEIAPLLELSPFIIDIVQSGETIKSHRLKVCATISATRVWLVSNPAYYKVYYESVDKLTHVLRKIV